MLVQGDNKVNTSFVITFSLPVEEKNIMTGQNVEVAEANGTLQKSADIDRSLFIFSQQIYIVHATGSSVNFAFFKTIRKFCLGFTMRKYLRV